MTWLKKADALTDMLDEKNPKKGKRERLLEMSDQIEEIGIELSQLGYTPMAAYRLSNEVKAYAEKLEKESAVYNDVEYQAQDLNIGDSGDFSEDAVHDGKPTTEVNPGPASTVPGSNAPNSPQIPGQDGALY